MKGDRVYEIMDKYTGKVCFTGLYEVCKTQMIVLNNNDLIIAFNI